jgi:hypothetical protein
MKIDTSEKIKPCPLCCSEAFLHEDKTKLSSKFFWVKCDNHGCGCTINSGKDSNKVLKRWNQRW